MLANAIADRAEKRHQRPDSSFRSAVQPRLRDGEAERRTVVVAGHEHRARGGVERQVTGCPVGLRSGLSERRDGDDHERRIAGAEGRIAQPQAIEVPGVKGLEQDIGRAGEGKELFAPFSGFEVKRDRALVPVDPPPRQAGVRPLLAVCERTGVTERRPARRLHHDHVRAQVAKNLAAEQGPVVGKVQHSIW